MQLQKIAGMSAGKPVPEKAAKNVLPPKTSPSFAKPSSPAAGVKPLSALISSLGIPHDKLSACILSFVRFFSLPIKPHLLAEIRNTAFTQLDVEQERSDSIKLTDTKKAKGFEADVKNRQSLSLAGAAAESKGVGLNGKGLESYVKAIDPDWEERQNRSWQNSKQRGKKNNEQKDEGALQKSDIIGASSSRLEKAALEYAQKDDLLSIMNRLPGKNGQRWIVIPFNFDEGLRRFCVSMRILLEAQNANKYSPANRSAFMALDVVQTGDAENRWLFAAESANNKPVRLSVYIQNKLTPKLKTMYERELSSLLGIPVERIFVKKQVDSFLLEAGFTEELLNSIDETV